MAHVSATVSLLALTLSTFASHAATTAPKVVFIGDLITAGWSSAFAANPNWINKGSSTDANGSSRGVLARFQTDVVDLHPAIVHVMIGAVDAGAVFDSTWPVYSANFLNNLNSIVTDANAAKIQVVFGIEPPNFTSPNGAEEPLNAIVATYAAEHNIPVINYADALCGCVGSTGAQGVGYDYTFNTMSTSWDVTNYLVPPAGSPANAQPLFDSAPSAAGYALMTQMAEATINTLNMTPKSGYLQNVMFPIQSNPGRQQTNVNSVSPGSVLQFTPYGSYANGLTEPLLNSSFAGSSGTWASSDPLVMYVSQKGLAWSLSPGTAIITYTSPTGKNFNEWVMYVNAFN